MVIRVWKVVPTVCSTMDHPSACLLLLTCLAGFSASESEEGGTVGETSYGPSSVRIDGVDVVTVGIPYGFRCTAQCYPDCKFSWTRGSVTSQGPELSLQLLHIEPTQTLTCTVVNPTTGRSATVHKMLQVTAGPSNVRITGPTYLTTGNPSTFSCSASCYPSCSYSWTIHWEGQLINSTQGDTISVTPATDTVLQESLVCQAEDTVSHLYISTSVLLQVASISAVSIEGDGTVTMGKKYMFRCFASCNPSCNFKWLYMGKTFQGDQTEIPIYHQGDRKNFTSQLEITFSDYSKIEPLTCVVTNTVSHATGTATEDLTVINPISVRPTSQGKSVAGKPYSLQCVGSQNPASVTWLKNKHPMPASERVHFSPDNIKMTFSPLLQEDDGLYQCVVVEVGSPIQSVGYMMQVIYGPSSVVITGTGILTVGMLYDFRCSANCYPTCLFTWTRGDVTSSGPTLRLQLGELPPTQNLTCTAVNPDTNASASAQKMLQVIAGPSNIHISGPAFLTAGVASNFTCSADCYSSCSYSWTTTWEGETLGTALGNTISVTPPSVSVSESLSCKAEDTISHLYTEKALKLPVASLSNIAITGDGAVAMGKQYTYSCFATCNPSCEFNWKFMGKTFKGDQLEISISDYYKTEPLTCEATNTFSNVTITATMNLTVIDPFSVRPTSQAPPVAGKPFSMQCVGPQDPASITWLKNKRQIPATERVLFSSDNTTITFKNLLREDGGVFQCLVIEGRNHTLYYNALVVAVEGGTPILSVGYKMQVNYGPEEALIVKPNKGPVGEEMIVEPGSTTELQCLADCFPDCLINWSYYGKPLSTSATIYFTPVTPPYEAALICMAFNSVTSQNRSALTTVVVPDGPKYVTIKGSDALEIGVTASFTCSAECSPSCTFKWTVYGKNMTGSVVDITVNRHVSKETISCQAENTYNGKTVKVNKTISVSDPHWCGC